MSQQVQFPGVHHQTCSTPTSIRAHVYTLFRVHPSTAYNLPTYLSVPDATQGGDVRQKDMVLPDVNPVRRKRWYRRLGSISGGL